MVGDFNGLDREGLTEDATLRQRPEGGMRRGSVSWISGSRVVQAEGTAGTKSLRTEAY